MNTMHNNAKNIFISGFVSEKNTSSTEDFIDYEKKI